ncbi:DUF1294 domain-containing protein [Pseudomonas shirazensis]
MEVLFVYFLIVNFLTFIITGYDKYLAVKHKRRVPENTLFLLATVGGSLGLLLAMFLFRHKTSKTSFIVKFSAIFLIQFIIVVLIFSGKI